MRNTMRWALAGAVIFAASLAATNASADVKSGSGEIEVYAGWLWPDDDPGIDTDDLTYGIRLGYNVTEHFGITGSLGYWEANDSVALLGYNRLEADGLFFDLSFEWIINPDSRAAFLLFGGPGYASFNGDLVDKTGVLSTASFDDDVFTAHAGVALRAQVTDRFYLRPDVRVRWNDSDLHSDDAYDWEASLGFGWYLGR